MPAMFIFDSASFAAPFGSIQPNIRDRKPFGTAGAGFRRRTESPQKVKKIPTFAPEAAMPHAMISAAIALSRSLLKRTIAARWPPDSETGAASGAVPPLRSSASR